MLPLGLRQFNPGNLRPSNPEWQGTIGEGSGFAIFDSMQNGIRALCKQIIAYQEGRRGLQTVREVISTWAPSNENDTGAYITAVCHMLDCNPDDKFKFRDPDFLFWIASAIGMHENGPKAFSENVTDDDIDAGVAAALV